MDFVQMVQEIVNSLGFPIAMVVYFIWDKNHTMEPVVESINNMNKFLAILCDKLDLEGELKSQGDNKNE